MSIVTFWSSSCSLTGPLQLWSGSGLVAKVTHFKPRGSRSVQLNFLIDKLVVGTDDINFVVITAICIHHWLK